MKDGEGYKRLEIVASFYGLASLLIENMESYIYFADANRDVRQSKKILKMTKELKKELFKLLFGKVNE
jgi:hypothetical protein